MSTIKRPQRHKRNTRQVTPGNLPAVLDAIPSTCTFSTPNVTCTYPIPISLKGLPTWLTNTGKIPTSVTLLAPNIVRCGFTTPGSVTSIIVAERDPAIRTPTGGYARPGTFLAPAP